MNEQKYQIFISSTYEDLKIEREMVLKTILSLYHIPIGMELFSAEDNSQWEIIKRTIQLSDYYILILGSRYGSLTAEGISFTEKEYNFAEDLQIPILAFLSSDTAPVQTSHIEKEPEKLAKLNEFRNRVRKSGRMVAFFENHFDLGKQVSLSLQKSFITNPRTGWVRANSVVSKNFLEETATLLKENRALKNEIDLLRKDKNRGPSFLIEIIKGREFCTPFSEVYKYEIKPLPILKDNFPEILKPYINQEEIDDYNSNLPDTEAIEKYNKSIILYNIVKDHAQELSIRIENIGQSKATNLFVQIDFPSEIFVIDKSHKEAMEIPESPLQYPNPIDKAEERRLKNESLKTGMALSNSLIGSLSQKYPFLDYSIFSPSLTLEPLHSINHYAERLNDHSLKLHKNSLIQTMDTIFDSEDDFLIAATRPGEYSIKLSLICEEIPETINQELKIVAKECNGA